MPSSRPFRAVRASCAGWYGAFNARVQAMAGGVEAAVEDLVLRCLEASSGFNAYARLELNHEYDGQSGVDQRCEERCGEDKSRHNYHATRRQSDAEPVLILHLELGH